MSTIKTIDSRLWMKQMIQVRRTLIRRGVSRVNLVMVSHYVTQIEAWMKCWRPTEEQMRKYLVRHQNQVKYIIPGPDSKSHETFVKEFESIIQNQII